MDIYPQDLGLRRQVTLIQMRTRGSAWNSSSAANAEPPSPYRGTLGRIWAKGLPLTPDESAATLPAAAPHTLSWMYGAGVSTGTGLLFLPVLLTFLGTSLESAVAWAGYTAVTSVGVLALPRWAFHRLHRKPVTLKEIDRLLAAQDTSILTGSEKLKAVLDIAEAAVLRGRIQPRPKQYRSVIDPLERDYLELVRAVIQLPPQDAVAENEIREALQAISRTLTDLPPAGAVLTADDPVILGEQAQKLAEKASRERDPVIAASLERRAETMAGLAETVVQAQQLMRRNQALRLEIADQMRALRFSLTASALGQRQESSVLATLAARTQRVAQEAVAVSAARAEVENLLHLGASTSG